MERGEREREAERGGRRDGEGEKEEGGERQRGSEIKTDRQRTRKLENFNTQG